MFYPSKLTPKSFRILILLHRQDPHAPPPHSRATPHRERERERREKV
jgi:hypothetical protein